MWDVGSIWQGARQGALVLRACADCGAVCHPPLPMCPHCQSLHWQQQAASGTADLLSWLVSVHPGDAAQEPRVVIVVRLAEGVNFVSNLIGAAIDTLHEGMALELCFAPSEDLVLPLFRPARVLP
jgi:uncharacterized OB-fold protein